MNLYDNDGGSHTLSGARIINRSSADITVNPNFTTDGAGTWQAQVVNGSGRSSGRYSFEVKAVAATPSISRVSPSEPQATDGRQNFTIYGRDFDSSAYVNVYDNGGGSHTLWGARIINGSSTHITVNPNFTTDGAGRWQAQVVNGSGRVSDRYSFQVKVPVAAPLAPSLIGPGTSLPDMRAPTVSAFDVGSRSGLVGQSFTIPWTVFDTGGSGLNRVELWRANDSGGTPVGWAEVKRTPVSGNGPSSGSFTDAPTSTGSYWYGIHVVDNAGKWSAEPSPVKVMLSEQPATAKPNNSTAGPLKFDHGRVLNLVSTSSLLSPLNDEQESGLDQILTFIENDREITDVRWAAYMLATVKAEISNFQPIEEDPELWKLSTGAGKYAELDQTSGHRYYGRGYVQITWKDKYSSSQFGSNQAFFVSRW